MKQQVTISAQTRAKTLKVENRILTRDIPTPTDAAQTVEIDPQVFFDKITERPQFGLLPPGVRWMSEDGHSLIIEEPPSFKTFSMRQSKQGDYGTKVETFTVPMPRLVYGISPDHANNPHVSHLYGTYDELIDDESLLCIVPIPNVFKTGAICTHTLLNDDPDATYHSLVNRCIADFWFSIFNNDVGDYAASEGWQWLVKKAEWSGYGNGFKAWSNLSHYDLSDMRMSKTSYIGTLKRNLLKINHSYSSGLGEVERMMTTLVAISLENSIIS